MPTPRPTLDHLQSIAGTIADTAGQLGFTPTGTQFVVQRGSASNGVAWRVYAVDTAGRTVRATMPGTSGNRLGKTIGESLARLETIRLTLADVVAFRDVAARLAESAGATL